MGRQDHQSDGVATLLAIARQRLSEGNPSLALQAVVMALKVLGGEAAVVETLARARSVYQSQMHASAAADELTALFAECAIAEVSPSVDSVTPLIPNLELELPSTSSNFGYENGSESDATANQAGAPILAESGRMQIVSDASSDGSSFICLQCGGVVSNLRRDEHFAYWCSHTP